VAQLKFVFERIRFQPFERCRREDAAAQGLSDTPRQGGPRTKHALVISQDLGIAAGSLPHAGQSVGGRASIARGVFGVPIPEMIFDDAQIVATVRQRRSHGAAGGDGREMRNRPAHR